jgi:hypothetical protein
MFYWSRSISMDKFIEILQEWSQEFQDDNDAALAKLQEEEKQQQEKSND